MKQKTHGHFRDNTPGQLSTHSVQGFSFLARVYYEDTDAGGVVYYANYLKFAERARTEFLRHKGATHASLLRDYQLLFMVRHISVDYQAAARLDDLLDISAEVVGCGAATLDMRQIIRHEGETLAELKVTLVAVSSAGKVVRLPAALRDTLGVKASSQKRTKKE